MDGSESNLDTAGHISTLFRSASEAITAICRPLSRTPAKTLRSSMKHVPYAVILQILQTEGQRIHAQCGRQFIHMRLPREMVRRGGQTTIGTDAQGRLRLVIMHALIRHRIRRVEGRWSREIIIELPGHQPAIP